MTERFVQYLNDEEILAILHRKMSDGNIEIPPNVRYMDRKRKRKTTIKVNDVLSLIIAKTKNINETNQLNITAVNVVANIEDSKRKTEEIKANEKKNWRKRIRMKLEKALKEWGQLNRITKGELKDKVVIRKLNRQYKLERSKKQTEHESTQKVIPLKVKLKRYDARCKCFEQNRLFQLKRRRLFEAIEEGKHSEKSKEFWEGCGTGWRNTKKAWSC